MTARALPDEEIAQELGDLPGWRHERDEIHKWFRFSGFPESMAFLGRLVEPCERMNHHPDIENHYDRVRIGLQTWSVGGVTQKDLDLAREIERLAPS